MFSAKAGFSAEESASWWLCYDTLQMVDRELEQVDSLLADARIPRLAARGLAYIDKPARLAKLIPTDDWHPVDAQIRVGAVASLVAKLGGAELYGDNLEVPLRELIQNGADAVRARRTLEKLPSNWGKVQVRLITDEAEQWIEVTDTGVGMSASVLTGPFLDFGTSFWGSHMMHSEFPGLESAGFESTGKFGIGFFSVFMWGDCVQVITRRYERGRDETQVLEFQKGLSGRPMLRPARPDEYLREGGTKVRVRLEHGIDARALLHPFSDVVPLTLEEVCAKLCATSDVTIQVFEPADTWATAVEANDWMVMDGEALLQRINKPVQVEQVQSVTRACTQFGKLLEPVYNEGGQMIGRATLMASRSGIGTGVGGLLTVGGFAATGMSGIAGVLLGTVKGAARDSGIPLLAGDCLRNFATSQISKLKKKAYKDPVSQHALAVTVRQLGGMPENLPVARGAEGWLTPASLIAWAEAVEEIFLVDIYILRSAEKFGPNFRLAPEVLACESGYPGIIHSSSEDWPMEDRGDYEGGTLLSFVVDCIANAWKVPRKRLYDKAMQRDARKTIGIVGSERIMDRVYTLTRKVGRG